MKKRCVQPSSSSQDESKTTFLCPLSYECQLTKFSSQQSSKANNVPYFQVWAIEIYHMQQTLQALSPYMGKWHGTEQSWKPHIENGRAKRWKEPRSLTHSENYRTLIKSTLLNFMVKQLKPMYTFLFICYHSSHYLM